MDDGSLGGPGLDYWCKADWIHTSVLRTVGLARRAMDGTVGPNRLYFEYWKPGIGYMQV